MLTKTEIIYLFRNYLFLPHIFIVHSFILSFHSANGNFTIASCTMTLQCDKMIVNLKDSLTTYSESTFLQVRHFDYLDQSEISFWLLLFFLWLSTLHSFVTKPTFFVVIRCLLMKRNRCEKSLDTDPLIYKNQMWTRFQQCAYKTSWRRGCIQVPGTGKLYNVFLVPPYTPRISMRVWDFDWMLKWT